MLILSTQPRWHWKPCVGHSLMGPFACHSLEIGYWRLALVNRRLKEELQRQIRAQFVQH